MSLGIALECAEMDEEVTAAVVESIGLVLRSTTKVAEHCAAKLQVARATVLQVQGSRCLD